MSVRLLFVFKSFNQDVSNMWTVWKNTHPPHRHTMAGLGLPKKRILYTVLRSPHIDKKSREQFEMKIYKQYVALTLDSDNPHDQITRLIHTTQDNPGVQSKVVIQYKTRFFVT